MMAFITSSRSMGMCLAFTWMDKDLADMLSYTSEGAENLTLFQSVHLWNIVQDPASNAKDLELRQEKL